MKALKIILIAALISSFGSPLTLDLQSLINSALTLNFKTLTSAINKSVKEWKAQIYPRFSARTKQELKRFLGSKIWSGTDLPDDLKQIMQEFYAAKNMSAPKKYVVSTIQTVYPSSASTTTSTDTTYSSENTADSSSSSSYSSASFTTSSTTTSVNDSNSNRLLAFTTTAANFPASYDLRSKYPYCSSITLIRDQSDCGSCWAFSSMNTISDRYCIANGVDRSFAPQDVLECCVGCQTVQRAGCYGGYASLALFWVKYRGVCSGEIYGDNSKCKPYFLSPTSTDGPAGPTCVSSCGTSAKYPVVYKNDKFTITDYIQFYGEQQMMLELLNRGTILATFDLYEDFYAYSGGIYTHVAGDKVDVHSARVIGYGTLNGVNYWLCSNTWGTSWGEGGFFKIRRSTNECNFERYTDYAHII